MVDSSAAHGQGGFGWTSARGADPAALVRGEHSVARNLAARLCEAFLQGCERATHVGASLLCIIVLVCGAGTGHAASPQRTAWQGTPPPEADRIKLASTSDVPVAFEARAAESAGVTRLTFDLSGAVPVKAYVLEKPARVIVDLPEVNFQVASEAGKLRTQRYRTDPVLPVRAFRTGQVAHRHRSRGPGGVAHHCREIDRWRCSIALDGRTRQN